MARSTTFVGQTTAITNLTAQTIVFTPAQLAGAGVVAFHLFFQGAAAATTAINQISRIRVFSGGEIIMNVGVGAVAGGNNHLGAYLSRFSRADYLMANTDRTLTLPFYFPDVGNEDDADLSGFPLTGNPSIEVDLAATVTTGALGFGWTLSSIVPKVYPVLLSQPMGIAASQNTATYYFAEEGSVTGYGLNTTGLQRMKLVLGGVPRDESFGPLTGAGVAQGNLYTEDQRMERTSVNVTNPIFKKLVGPQPAPGNNSSYVQLNTDATWAGVGNEFSYSAIRNQRI